MSVKKYKKDVDYSYALGSFPTMELLLARPGQVKRVYAHSSMKETEHSRQISRICREHHIEIVQNNKIFASLSPKENCYMIGVFDKYAAAVSPTKSHIVLVNPGNMGNLGTIARTALGFNMTDIAIISPAVDCFDPKVIRASMGALFKVNLQYFPSFSDYMEIYADREIYPFMLNGTSKLQQVEHDPNRLFSVIFGNESSGLPDEFLQIGKSVVIAHSDAIDSLNLPVSVGMALFQLTKCQFTS